MAVYTQIDNPELYFQCKLYTGNGTAIGSGGQAITLDGDEDMQPDLVIIKNRGATGNHIVTDAVRTAPKMLLTDGNDVETNQTEGLTSFNSDGFTVGSLAEVNTNTNTYVAWCWKETADAGFDMVLYTGNATNRTISHSLSAVPHWMVVKNRDSAVNWTVYHNKNTSAPETDRLLLNTTGATGDSDAEWNDTAPTSSVFSVGTGDSPNKSGDAIIAYLWTAKQGFSKFGSFVANSNTDGPFIYTGFRPALVIGKVASDTNDWFMFDNKRSSFNPVDDSLFPNKTDAESTSHVIDFLSNGFKIRDSDGTVNSTGNTYIYIAFAEAPLVNSNGVPCNAR